MNKEILRAAIAKLEELQDGRFYNEEIVSEAINQLKRLDTPFITKWDTFRAKQHRRVVFQDRIVVKGFITKVDTQGTFHQWGTEQGDGTETVGIIEREDGRVCTAYPCTITFIKD